MRQLFVVPWYIWSRQVGYDANGALELLRIGSRQPAAAFREGQEDSIRHIVEGQGRLLVVQRTGWGKSFVYFIATKLLREAGSGPALLISPLLSLMRNQLAAAHRMGLQALTIHSENEDDWDSIEAAVRENKADILIISPERLANERFKSGILTEIAAKVSLLVVDEAHCISDWGHDFRPQYRLLERTVRNLPASVRLLATTATANNRVTEDLRQVLGPNLTVVRGDLNRPSLRLQTLSLSSQAERLAWLADNIPKLAGSGIIYALTKRDANRVAEWLQSRGINARAYTADSGEEREGLEQALLDNSIKVLVATTSLGMGFDKPDLAFVIHYQTPGSAVAYYQQVGRAGRALAGAYGVLLSGVEDADITDFFIESAFPTPHEVQSVLKALESAPAGLSVPELLGLLNIRSDRLKKTLDLLSLEVPSPLVKQGPKWQLTAAVLNPAFWDRAKRLTELRRGEQREMQDYVKLPSGHMEFLIRALDGDSSGVRPPELPPLPAGVDEKIVREAIDFQRRISLPFEPRKQWPPGGMPAYGLVGKIAATRQAQPGKALCYWQDAGWGSLVQEGKYKTGRFSDDLVQACVRMVESWGPSPGPTWLTCIPSLKHPEQVPEFSQRLAAALGIPFRDVLAKTVDRPEQKEMANGMQQARNVDGSLGVTVASLPNEPVFLVDDMAKSGWTFTVAAWLLQERGAGVVYPLALALA